MRWFLGLITLCMAAVVAASFYASGSVGQVPAVSDLIRTAVSAVGRLSEPVPVQRAPLADRLRAGGFAAGQPVFLRLFKQDSALELWMRDQSGWRLFETYPICRWSGTLGPKQAEGDLQAPEGVYTVAASQLNPASRYHLAMNIGYPNGFDRSRRRTGSAIMIHGNCVSIGCFAMTDAGIDDIYGLTEAALKAGQGAVPVHIFPFRMTAENFESHRASPWKEFWQDLKHVHDAFEDTRKIPNVRIENARYVMGRG